MDPEQKVRKGVYESLRARDLPWTKENVLMVLREQVDALVAAGRVIRTPEGRLYIVNNGQIVDDPSKGN